MPFFIQKSQTHSTGSIKMCAAFTFVMATWAKLKGPYNILGIAPNMAVWWFACAPPGDIFIGPPSLACTTHLGLHWILTAMFVIKQIILLASIPSSFFFTVCLSVYVLFCPPPSSEKWTHSHYHYTHVDTDPHCACPLPRKIRVQPESQSYLGETNINFAKTNLGRLLSFEHWGCVFEGSPLRYRNRRDKI